MAKVTQENWDRVQNNKTHWAKICRKNKKCPYCPPHGGENAGRRKK